jgi:pyrroline-5-carboxylate reductase
MKIAIIGCGAMGSSMAKQLSRNASVAVFDKFPEKISFRKDHPEIRICRTPEEAMEHADLILLFVKPHDLKATASELKQHLTSHQIVVSGLAGTSLAQLKKAFGEKTSILRIMPNLAVEYGQGVVGCAEAPEINALVKEKISSAFSVLGLILWLPEDKIDALTALASSGPAFMLIIIEAMIDAGIAMGFTSSDARHLILQTLAGTLSLLEKTGKHPGELRWQVSSPAGTTIAGTLALEEANVRAGIIQTFMAAKTRAAALAARDD